jgi:hypothetical protein
MGFGVIAGPKGALQSIVVRDRDDGETPTGRGFNHHARRVETIGKISVNVAIGVSHN